MVRMTHYGRTSTAPLLIAGLLLFMAGFYLGDKLNNAAHAQAAEIRIQAAVASHDLDVYRADLDVEAPAHAARAVRLYVREVGP